jgi:hypothetical protein
MSSKRPLCLAALLVVGLARCGGDPIATVETVDSSTASYTVVFDATWSQTTHPTSFPAGPHLSGLIGGTHGPGVTFWEAGGLSSPGIRAMAEAGSKGPLGLEVEDAILAGTASRVLSGGGIGLSPGNIELTFEMKLAFPLVTLVSMIAPSPDWFVGVQGVSLLDDGTWVDSLVVDLRAYDAGTDSGVTYTSANVETVPPAPIVQITESPFDVTAAVGTFTFSKN